MALLSAAVAHATTLGLNFTGAGLDTVRALSNEPMSVLRPPDTIGAVGPQHIVEFTNGTYSVFAKTTGAVAQQTLDSTFWAEAGIAVRDPLADPRVVYDPGTRRFYAVEVEIVGANNRILLARSNTSDPTQGWKAVSFIGTPGALAEYPTLSFNAEGIFVGTNDFTGCSTTCRFAGVSLHSIPKADVVSAPPTLARKTTFNALNASTHGFTLQAALQTGPPMGAVPVIAIDNDVFDVLNRFDVHDVGGPGAARLGPASEIALAPRATRCAPLAAQPDGTAVIDTFCDRFSANVVQVGDTLFMVDTVYHADRAALRWVLLSDSANVVLDEGLITHPDFDYYQGAIAANAFGDVVVAFNRSSEAPGEFASAFARIGALNGTELTFGPDILLQAGEANYHLAGDIPERWGDYSAVVVDPSDPHSFWAFQEFAGTGNLWKTQITQIFVDRPVAISGPGSWILVALGCLGLLACERWR